MKTAFITERELRNYLAKELPVMIEENPNIQKSIYLVFRPDFSQKDKTDERFDRMFEELQKDREENSKERKKTDKRLDDSIRQAKEESKATNERLDVTMKRLDDTIRQSEKTTKEINKRLDETIRKSDEQWKEQNRKSDERFEAMLQEIRDIRSKQTSQIGALGARWGIAAESSFRNGLRAILENRFDVQVLNVNEYDHEGFVFRQPDQVELDIIIKNGEIIACEIKSSVSRSDTYTFHRKVRFYEKHHNCKVTTMMIISPMIDSYAQKVAEKLGIEIYSYSEDVRL